MNHSRHLILLLLLVNGIIIFSGNAAAEVDWQVTGAIQLEGVPLDVAKAQETDLTFILIDQSKVLIFAADGRHAGTVPVDASVTDIAVNAKGDQLYLINSERKSLQTIDINFIIDINVTGSPFLGPPGAEVTVVVFSDFQ